MTNLRSDVPEPDQQKKDDTNPLPVSTNIQHPISSGDDDSEGEADLVDMGGYQPLTLSENDAGGAEFHASPLDSDSSDGEGEENDSNTRIETTSREMAVNTDLVLHAMRGISLPGTNIPPWAKELTDSEWNDLVKRTISGDSAENTASNNAEPKSGDRT